VSPRWPADVISTGHDDKPKNDAEIARFPGAAQQRQRVNVLMRRYVLHRIRDTSAMLLAILAILDRRAHLISMRLSGS
jgi:hypothetical protein